MDIFTFNDNFLIAIVGIVLVMIYGYITNKADISGILAGGAIALTIYIFVQWQGIAYFFTFFIIGSLASKWKYREKEKLRLAEENKGRRSAIHAFSNAGPAAVFSLLGLIPGMHENVAVAVASVFAAALSDTLSSELGNVFGSKHFNILSFQKDLRGLDGVISFEGTIAGVTGSALISILYFFYNQNAALSFVVFFAGIIANLLDSVLGASLQRRGYLNNHHVNLVTTAFAGLTGFILALYL